MSRDGWCEIKNANEDYLQWKKNFTIIITRLKKIESKTYQEMYSWCEENVQGSWGPAQLSSYDGFITWRFWREQEAKEFQKKFNRFITGRQLLSY